MKYLTESWKLFILLCVLLIALPAIAQGQTVAWDDPNPESAQVTEYRLYHSVDNGATWDLIATIPTGVTEYTLTLDVETGMHVFSVTAANWVAESERSNALTIQTNKPTPVEIRVSK